MTLGATQSIVIGSDTISAPRTSTGNNQTTYMSSDGDLKLTIAHTYGKRTRRLVRIQLDKFVPNPYNPAVNIVVSSSARITLDVPPGTVTNTEGADLLKALCDFAEANRVAVSGGEN
jgi:hypothetical protein